MTIYPHGKGRQYLVFGFTSQDEHVAVFVDDVYSPIRSDGRRRKRRARPGDPRPVNLLARIRTVSCQHAVIVDGHQMAAIQDRCGQVGTSFPVAPRHRRAGSDSGGQAKIALRASSNCIDGSHGRVTCGYVDHPLSGNGGRDDDFGIRAHGPQERASSWLVGPNEPSFGNQLVPGGIRHDRRRRPGRRFIARHFPVWASKAYNRKECSDISSTEVPSP